VWVIFFIVQVVGVGSAPGFLKINYHVFSQKNSKISCIDIRFFKIQKFPNFLSPRKKGEKKNPLLDTQLKRLQKLKISFSKSCLRKFQAPMGGTREKFPPLYKSEPVLNLFHKIICKEE
jgi:hypothetical protein